METINETLNYPSEWLKWEEDGWYSRDTATILAGSGSDRVLTSGMVLGKITATGKWVQMVLGAADGSQNAAGILLFDTTAPNGSDVRAAIIKRHAKVSDNGITWPTGASAGQIATGTAALVALGIEVGEGA